MSMAWSSPVPEGGTWSDALRLEEIVRGLRRPRPSIPSKYFYDEAGSRLFDQICDLPEYYPTRTEIEIMERHGGEMAALFGSKVLLIELGSGSSLKTRILLDHLDSPAGYVPVDISCDHLLRVVEGLASEYPQLSISPLCADYTESLELPLPPVVRKRTAVYFPGSTLGNFEPDAAHHFLDAVHSLCRPDGALLIGIDLVKERAVLEAAYNDAAGVTARFNRNVLLNLNRTFGANFDPAHFEHRAFFNEEESRIEMHLVSRLDHEVRIGPENFVFREGDSIHTENSHKYTLDGFAELASRSGLQVQKVWTDERRYFSVQYLTLDAS